MSLGRSPVKTLLLSGLSFALFLTLFSHLARAVVPPYPSEPGESGYTFYPVTPPLDSDGDGLPDVVESSGIVPVIFETFCPASEWPIPPEGSVLYSWMQDDAIYEWVFTNGYTYVVGEEAFDRVWVSMNGLLSFGTPLDSKTPLTYPMAKVLKNRLQIQIPQFAFLQGDNRVMKDYGDDPLRVFLNSELYFFSSSPSSQDMILKNICFGDDLEHSVSVWIQFLENQCVRFTYSSPAALQYSQQTHTIGWHIRGTGGMLEPFFFNGKTFEFRPFFPSDPHASDSNLDGVDDFSSLSQGQEPGWQSDVDGDGLWDGWENYWFGGLDVVSDPLEVGPSGFSRYVEMLNNMCPHEASRLEYQPDKLIAGWKIFDPFESPGYEVDDMVFERTFEIQRNKGWQQFFLSADPERAEGWALEDLELYWRDSEGEAGVVSSSPDDSFYLPISTNSPERVTIQLMAKGSRPRAKKPLYLLRWAPEVEFWRGRKDQPETFSTITNGVAYTVMPSATLYDIPVVLRRNTRPHNAPPTDLEVEGTAHPFHLGWDEREYADLKFTPTNYLRRAVIGGKLSLRNAKKLTFPTVPSPRVLENEEPPEEEPESPATQSVTPFSTISETPAGDGEEPVEPELWTPGELFIINPRIYFAPKDGGYQCSMGGGCPEVSYNWMTGEYERDDSYPLDEPCLWDAIYSPTNIVAQGTLCTSCWPYFSLGVSDMAPPRDNAWTNLFEYIEEAATIHYGRWTLNFQGTQIWKGENSHYTGRICDDWWLWSNDGCGGCPDGCSDGSCDEYSGPSVGSARFRISLGAPEKGKISGFLWFVKSSPSDTLRAAEFSLLTREDAEVDDVLGSGIRRITCWDNEGRTLIITNVVDGVDLAVRKTETEALEHIWEIRQIVMEEGRGFRFRQINPTGNVLFDTSYLQGSDLKWRVVDPASKLSVEHTDSGSLTHTGSMEFTEISRVGNEILSQVRRVESRIGEGEDAVLRVTSEVSDDRWMKMLYWNDSGNPARHGKLKFRYGNSVPWSYHLYNMIGMEVLRLEQWQGAPFGNPEYWDRIEPEYLVDIDLSLTCRITESSYVAFSEEDSNHDEDRFQPRTESVYIQENGTRTLIGRTWFIYTRASSPEPIVTVKTIRAHSPSAVWSDPKNAVSSQTRYDETDATLHKALRGRPLRSEDEAGLKTEIIYMFVALYHQYDHWSLWEHSTDAPFLRIVTRQFTDAAPDGIAGKSTLDVVFEELSSGRIICSGTELEEPGSATTVRPIAMPINSLFHDYDSEGRLIYTRYTDGTVDIKNYDCCSLRSTTDRFGKTTLYVSTPGMERLHYAVHEVSLGEIYEGGDYPVTEYWMDAFGRTTNVVYTTRNGLVQRTEQTAYKTGNEYTWEETQYVDWYGNRTVTQRKGFENYEESVTYEYPADASGAAKKNESRFYRNGERVTREYIGNSLQVERKTKTSYTADGGRVEVVTRGEAETGFSEIVERVATYDFLGRVVSQDMPKGTVVHTYDGASQRVLTSVVTAGNVMRQTTYLYDEMGNQVGSESDGIRTSQDERYEKGVIESWSPWEQRWHVIETTVQDLASQEIRTSSRRENMSNSRTRFTHSVAENNTVSETTQCRAYGTNDEITTNRVDGAAQTVSVSRYGVLLSEEAQGERLQLSYDGFGQVLRRRLEGVDGSLIFETTLTYDTFGNQIKTVTTYPSGLAVENSFLYDSYGKVVSSTNPIGDETTYTYDAAGRLTGQRGAVYPANYAYDSQNRRIQLETMRREDLGWDVTQWSYNALTGLPERKIYADNSQVNYTYTSGAALERTTWARGAWKENAYTSQGHLSGITYSDETRIDYSYNGSWGSLTDVAIGRDTSFTYSEQRGNSFGYERWRFLERGAFVFRKFDERWRTKEVTVEILFDRLVNLSGKKTVYQEPAVSIGVLGMNTGTLTVNLPTQPDVSGTSSSTRYYYSPETRLYGLEMQNYSGNVASLGYRYERDYEMESQVTVPGKLVLTKTLLRDERRELVTNITYRVNGRVLSSRNYAYDLLGRLVERRKGSEADSFEYNTRSEVSREILSECGEKEYGYDLIGNRGYYIRPGYDTTTEYSRDYFTNPLNQYGLIDYHFAGSFTYDADGNMVERRFSPQDWWEYAWDAENRLIRVKRSDVVILENSYDHLFRRVRKVTPNATHDYVYDGWNLAVEIVTDVEDSSNVSVIEYFWGKDLSGTLQGAGGVGGLVAVSMDGSFYFPLYDQNGNIIGYVDESGNIAAAYEYDAFGQTVAQGGALADRFRFRFSTKYHDSETGFYYYGYRFYAPELGRWLNRDPVGEEGGMNLYGFVKNNPLKYFDALGCVDGQIYVEGVGAGWAGWSITLNGKTAIRLNGSLHYITGRPQRGMRFHEGGSSSSMLIYKADAPKKELRIDYHKLPENNNQPAWHLNTKPGVAKITKSQARNLNHKMSPTATFTGRTITLFRRGGAALFVAGGLMDLIDIYEAEDRVREVTKKAVGYGAGILAAKAGAKAGMFVGGSVAVYVGQAGPQVVLPEELITVPLGATIGGVIGGIGGGVIGFFAGHEVTDIIWDWAFTPLEKEEWIVCHEYAR